MKRAAMTSAVILMISLGAAWVEWTSEEAVDLEGKVVLLQGDAAEITAVRWVSEDTEATIARQSDELGSYFWVDYVRWSERNLPADRTADDTGDAEETTERVASRSAFKSAGKSDDLMATLSPMVAQRSLVVTDPEKLESIGLAEPTSSIEIDRGGRTQKLSVGGESYGSRDYYVRHEDSGKIYLVDRDLIQPLKYARTRLPDRSLFGGESADLARAKVSAGTDALDLVQINPDDDTKSAWAKADAPEVAADQPTTWMKKFLGLKGTRYADPESPPEGLEARFTVALVGREATTTVAVTQVGTDGDWYAQSEHTRGLIKLVRSGANGLADDVEGLLSQ